MLGLGLAGALWLGSKAPREQHLRLVLGEGAPLVSAMDLQYLAVGGEVVRAARFGFEPGRAPRIVAHDPELSDGDYQLSIEMDTREGRRSTQRRVRLGGGTTQVDLAGTLAAARLEAHPAQ